MASRQVKLAKVRGSGSVTLRVPSDEAATKLLYLALRNLGVHWKPAIHFLAARALMSLLTFSHPASSRHTSATMDLVPH